MADLSHSQLNTIDNCLLLIISIVFTDNLIDDV
jgi:hypothetical protein